MPLLVNTPQLKTFFSYILFFSLALRPLYNVGYVAYFELNIDYIIETYCKNKEKPEIQCNGKCHLATQLASNLPDNSTDSSYFGAFFEAFMPVYFQYYKLSSVVFDPSKTIKNNWNYKHISTTVFKDSLDRPPQV
ncbi:hypothetical protein VOI54_04345 [Tamlana sp. 2201CG12-4]|uniref:hypothetical protein n=1 Tax=Tamlana sp. 2201CG12-4 TaxID=3112582 RepID=UPI002DBE14F9|nr:hypothetical protein [Tamlana sp. 2201CG12-4]MEC3906234.1 hypothetical protein [Tamlana sp. 2201CG12-4]